MGGEPWTRAAQRRTAGFEPVRRVPVFALGFAASMLAADMAVTHLLPGGRPEAVRSFGISLDALLRGEAWRAVTATMLVHDQGMLLRQLALSLLAIGLYERRVGTARAAGMFWTTDLLGTAILFGGIAWPYAAFVDPATPFGATHDVGMSGGGFGILGALAHDLGGRRRRMVLAGGLAALGAMALRGGDPIADALHLVTFGLGYVGAGLLASRRGANLAKR